MLVYNPAKFLVSKASCLEILMINPGELQRSLSEVCERISFQMIQD